MYCICCKHFFIEKHTATFDDGSNHTFVYACCDKNDAKRGLHELEENEDASSLYRYFECYDYN